MSPKFATIEVWTVISGMTRRHTYNELGLGNLKAIKVGKRTLVDVEVGLAWLKSCPPAQISPPKYNPAPTQFPRMRDPESQTGEQDAA